jgi:hypothetical protein
MTCRTLRFIVTLALSLLVTPFATHAQVPVKVPRIGILAAGSFAPDRARNLEPTFESSLCFTLNFGAATRTSPLHSRGG